MKTLIYALVLIVTLASCQKEPQLTYAVLSGKILNADFEDLILYQSNSSFKKNIPLKTGGSFRDTVMVRGDHFSLYGGSDRLDLYLEPEGDINIQFDIEDFDNTLKITGKGAAINNYLSQKNHIDQAVRNEDVDNIYLLNEVDFLKAQQKIKTETTQLITNYKGLPEDYVEKEKRNITYNYLIHLYNYEGYHRYYTKNPDFNVAHKAYSNVLDGLDYNNTEDYHFSSSYANLVNYYYNKKGKEIAESDAIAQDVAILKAVNTCPNEEIRNELLYKKAKFGVTYTSDLEAYYAEFLKGNSNDAYKQEVTESYLEMRKVATGQPSPKFIDYENYHGGTTSLDDLKGQYLYIDVWATWCGPCKAEIPYLKAIEETYHDKNIAFVSISVDTPANRDKWKNMIAQKDLGGVQLLADNAFKSQFVQDYYIKGIPRFILLDPNGDIVMSNAPRPSNDNLKAVLNGLDI